MNEKSLIIKKFNNLLKIKKKRNCPVCSSSIQKKIKSRSDYLKYGQYKIEIHPKICKCGLIFLNPVHSDKAYNFYYSNLYDEYYGLENKKDVGMKGINLNYSLISKRIKSYSYIKNNFITILDYGCGNGGGYKTLSREFKNSYLYAYEHSLEGLTNAMRNGYNPVTNDNKTKYKKNFDLIILRHVVEHFKHPIKEIKKLKYFLKDNGLIYISVPDMTRPRYNLRDYKNWWEYWFRFVHTSYFTPLTIKKVLDKSKLDLYNLAQQDEEIWLICGKKIRNKKFTFESSKSTINLYKEIFSNIKKFKS